ncbi:MAG TPA: UDP-N-acetylglucosamine 1-carboxyvinyltransferase [Acidimicrobiales bacterium]|nr:UDP-N-acetylglucosamine 1-carboxyvinyltransferase [Acidimicrobiales bacterium]
MDRFVVCPSAPLAGTVEIQGAKNSALKLMAASLLTTGATRLLSVPDITDVQFMCEMLNAIGAQVSRTDVGELIITTPEELTPIAPYELVEKMRASFVVLGPLLARHGFARVSLPGGDDFGHRPIDIHLRALSELGATFTTEHGYVEGHCDRLIGKEIALEFPSHTATDNVMMAAVTARGATVIENAAREPEVQDLAGMLTGMGAKISGAGTSRIEIEGVDELHPVTHQTIPDRIEAATFLAAVGLAGGRVTLNGARAEHMDMLLEKLVAMGMEIGRFDGGIVAESQGRLRSVDVATLPYPGVATDYKPILVTMLSVGSGVAIASENVFSGRFGYVDELRRMGADITIEGHHAIVRGIERLSGAPVRARDIRAGAALVLAGLVAEGYTEIVGVEHIDRGYEQFVAKLRAIGVDITRVQDGSRESS